jgi:hypothetical protein
MTSSKSSFVVQRGKEFVFFVVHPTKLLYYYKENGKMKSGEAVLKKDSDDKAIQLRVDEVLTALAL